MLDIKKDSQQDLRTQNQLVQDREDLEIVTWTVRAFRECAGLTLPTNTKVFHPILKACIRVIDDEGKWLSGYTRSLYGSSIILGIKPIHTERGNALYEIPDLPRVLAIGSIMKIILQTKRETGEANMIAACKRAKTALESIDSKAGEAIRGDLLQATSLKRDFALASSTLFLRRGDTK